MFAVGKPISDPSWRPLETMPRTAKATSELVSSGHHIARSKKAADARGGDGGSIVAHKLVTRHVDAARGAPGADDLDGGGPARAEPKIAPHMDGAHTADREEHPLKEGSVVERRKLAGKGDDDDPVHPRGGQRAQALGHGEQMCHRIAPEHDVRIGVKGHGIGGATPVARVGNRPGDELAVTGVQAVKGADGDGGGP